MELQEGLYAVLSGVVGFILSILLEVVPGLKDAWAKWPHKALSLLGAFVIVAVGWWALGCWTGLPLPDLGLVCTWEGGVLALVYGVIGWAGTQSGFGTISRNLPNAQARIEREIIVTGQ